MLIEKVPRPDFTNPSHTGKKMGMWNFVMINHSGPDVAYNKEQVFFNVKKKL